MISSGACDAPRPTSTPEGLPMNEGVSDGWAASAAAWIVEQGQDGDYGRRFVLDAPMKERIEGRGFRNALDVGCGEGRFCRIMQRAGIRTRHRSDRGFARARPRAGPGRRLSARPRRRQSRAGLPSSPRALLSRHGVAEAGLRERQAISAATHRSYTARDLARGSSDDLLSSFRACP
jgi:hypothetical protein